MYRMIDTEGFMAEATKTDAYFLAAAPMYRSLHKWCHQNGLQPNVLHDTWAQLKSQKIIKS